MKLRTRLRLWAFGGVLGLLAGLSYWYGWGCRACAKDAHPARIVMMFVLPAIFMADRWGRDHVREKLPPA